MDTELAALAVSISLDADEARGLLSGVRPSGGDADGHGRGGGPAGPAK